MVVSTLQAARAAVRINSAPLADATRGDPIGLNDLCSPVAPPASGLIGRRLSGEIRIVRGHLTDHQSIPSAPNIRSLIAREIASLNGWRARSVTGTTH